jgi:osmotically-inducible protein OsmY
MSKVRLSFAILALALLTVGTTTGTAYASASANATADKQAGAIKDGWLVTKLHSLFVPEDALSGSNIDVDVKNGMVTLQGSVPNEAARAKALEIAKGADGVKGVTDQLRIAPDTDLTKASDKANKAADHAAADSKKAGRKADDGWIKSKIYAQYMSEWTTLLDDSDIDVDVAKGVVTLKGTVKSAAARTKAVSIAKGTDGVKSVKNLLTVPTTH